MNPTEKARQMLLAARNEGRTIEFAEIGNATGLLDQEIRKIAATLPPPANPLEEITWVLAKYRGSDAFRVSRAAEKAITAVENLAQAVADDAGKAKLRRELAAAEAKVKALKAQLAGSRKTAEPGVVVQLVACDVCGKQVKPGNGISMHKRRAHGGAA